MFSLSFISVGAGAWVREWAHTYIISLVTSLMTPYTLTFLSSMASVLFQSHNKCNSNNDKTKCVRHQVKRHNEISSMTPYPLTLADAECSRVLHVDGLISCVGPVKMFAVVFAMRE